jgi:hypothetical protein
MLDVCDVGAVDDAVWVPSDLDEIPPGPELAAVLWGIDVRRISGYDRVVVLRAHQRLVSHYTAWLYEDMAAVVDALDEHNDTPHWDAAESAAAEIRAALTLTRRSADVEVGIALELRSRLPRVHAMLASGVLDLRRARVLLSDTGHLSDAAARRVIDAVADDAPSLTTGQLRARIRRLCVEVDPDDAACRYDDAVENRRVVAEPTDSGAANLLGLDLPPDRVSAATDRINRIARSLRGGGETRTMDQLRADVYLDLLCGTNHGSARRGVVDLRVDLATLAELNDRPGDLAGYGPVAADIARKIAALEPEAEWRYTVTDPATGQPLATGTTRRRPSATTRRAVESRSPVCVFPGCRMPAVGSDYDHCIAYADGGETSEANGDPLCRHDHCIKHQAGWTYTILPDGRHEWHTALGHTYTTTRDPP